MIRGNSVDADPRSRADRKHRFTTYSLYTNFSTFFFLSFIITHLSKNTTRHKRVFSPFLSLLAILNLKEKSERRGNSRDEEKFGKTGREEGRGGGEEEDGDNGER